MDMRPKAVLLCLLATGAGTVCGVGSADPGLLRVVASNMSMDQAVQMVEQRYHARVVRVQTQSADGRTVYVLKLLNDSGKVWTVRVDAANGSIL
jgi:hypothetical protein